MEKPNRLNAINFTKLIKLCEDYIDYVSSDNYCEDNDYDYYIFEEAINSIFGDSAWEYINSID